MVEPKCSQQTKITSDNQRSNVTNCQNASVKNRESEQSSAAALAVRQSSTELLARKCRSAQFEQDLSELQLLPCETFDLNQFKVAASGGLGSLSRRTLKSNQFEAASVLPPFSTDNTTVDKNPMEVFSTGCWSRTYSGHVTEGNNEISPPNGVNK